MKYSKILRNLCIVAACWLCPAPGVFGQGDAADPDIQILEKARVGTDGPALLAFLGKLSGNDADLLKVEQLIADLDGPTFKKREHGTRALVALGPAAYAALMRAKKSNTPEIAARASTCATAIYKDWDIWLRRAAVRRLLELEPVGTVQVLLRYLPYAADEELEEEIWLGVDGLVKRQHQLRGFLAGHLRDSVPSRRALAACILGHRGDLQQRLAVQQLLQDPNPGVRLRAAQGLLAAKEKAAIPVLIALLEEPQVDVGWQAEELLHWVAGYDSPGAKLGAASAELRRNCRSAWDKWWNANQPQVDLNAPQAEGRRPGLMLDSEQHPIGPAEIRTSWVWGCDGSRRWELKTLGYRPERFLPGNRVLALDWSKGGAAFSERDLEGKLLWQPAVKLVKRFPGDEADLIPPFHVPLLPRWCQRLPNGNTFVINGTTGCFELAPDGKLLYATHRFADGGASLDCEQLLPNGRVLCHRLEYPKKQTILAQLDPRTAVEHHRLVVPHADLHGFGQMFRVQLLKANHYLIFPRDRAEIREIDHKGFVVWRHDCRNYGAPLRLPGGNTLFQTLRGAVGSRVVEVTPDHKVVSEVCLPGSNTFASKRLCFSLVRLGFDEPLPGNIDLISSVPFRMKELRSKHLKLRQMSAYALQDLSTLPPTIVPELIDALDDADPWVRGGISGALSKMGPSILPEILKASTDNRPYVRISVLRILHGAIHDNTDLVIRALINALSDKRLDMRKVAILSIRDNLYLRRESQGTSKLTNPQVDALVQALIAAVESKETPSNTNAIDADLYKEVNIAPTAAIVLGLVGPRAAPAIPALIKAANGKNISLRGPAIGALASFGLAAKDAVPTLISVLRSKDVLNPEMDLAIRCAALRALGSIGNQARPAVPALKEALDDGNPMIRAAAIAALNSIQGDK